MSRRWEDAHLPLVIQPDGYDEVARPHQRSLAATGLETTVRTAGNIGFDTYLCHDACSTSNRTVPDGVDHDPELVHQLAEPGRARLGVPQLGDLQTDERVLGRVQHGGSGS